MTDAWEVIIREFDEDGDEGAAVRAVTDRLRVPGGWLYRVTRFNESHTANFDMPAVVALAFVPAAVPPVDDASPF
jgi:hypothetical protein